MSSHAGRQHSIQIKNAKIERRNQEQGKSPLTKKLDEYVRQAELRLKKSLVKKEVVV